MIEFAVQKSREKKEKLDWKRCLGGEGEGTNGEGGDKWRGRGQTGREGTKQV